MFYKVAFALVALLALAGTSASQGWLESKADLAFLILAVCGVVATVGGALLNKWLGQNHHGTSGAMGAAFLLAAVNAAIVVVAPILILIFGSADSIGHVAAGTILVIGLLLAFM